MESGFKKCSISACFAGGEVAFCFGSERCAATTTMRLRLLLPYPGPVTIGGAVTAFRCAVGGLVS
jgi:hypothetical protein